MLACDAWTVDWVTDSPVVSPAKPVRVVEYGHDDEFRHLGYTASLTARSRTAELSCDLPLAIFNFEKIARANLSFSRVNLAE